MYILSHIENWEYLLTPLLNCRRLFKSCQLSSFLSCYRSFQYAVPTFVPPSDISRYLVKCSECVIPTSVAHLANINCQPDYLCVKMYSKSVLLVSVVFTMWVVLVWSNLMSSSLLFILFRWLSSWFCSCCEETEYVPTWSTVNFPSYFFRCRSNFCFTFAWNLSKTDAHAFLSPDPHVVLHCRLEHHVKTTGSSWGLPVSSSFLSWPYHSPCLSRRWHAGACTTSSRDWRLACRFQISWKLSILPRDASCQIPLRSLPSRSTCWHTILCSFARALCMSLSDTKFEIRDDSSWSGVVVGQACWKALCKEVSQNFVQRRQCACWTVISRSSRIST